MDLGDWAGMNAGGKMGHVEQAWVLESGNGNFAAEISLGTAGIVAGRMIVDVDG